MPHRNASYHTRAYYLRNKESIIMKQDQRRETTRNKRQMIEELKGNFKAQFAQPSLPKREESSKGRPRFSMERKKIVVEF